MAKPEEIKSASDSRFAHICIYGEPGIGKSRLIGSSPGRVLVLRPPTDHLDSLLPADKKRVEEWVVNDWDDMNRALDYLRLEGGNDWDWVWVDSMSLLQDHTLDDIWETVKAEKPHRARYGLDQAEYGINMLRLGVWIRHVVGPDTFNFGFTAHAAMLYPQQVSKQGLDDKAEPKLMPWIQGKNMSPKFCGYMNQVLYMEVAKVGEEERRVIRTNASERYYAKDQYDIASNGRIVNPTMPKIVAAIEKARGVPLGTLPRKTKPAAPRRRIKKGS